MKLICDRTAFLDAINIVASVVATRTPKPQLQCVKLSAARDAKGAGSITLAATDGEMSIRLSTSSVDVHEPGEVLVPADKLRQIVSAEDMEPTLTIEAGSDTCVIRTPHSKFKVFGFPAAEFPPVPEFPAAGVKAQTFTIAAPVLATLITRTVFSTARENSRYAINGVLLRRKGKKLEMVATDGRRLALARGTAETGSAEDESACIIPTKALNVVLRLLGASVEKVRLAITENQVIFAFDDEDGGTVLASNLVEGTFPPYEEVIPKDHDKRATFDVNVLSSAVKKAALLTNEESRGVRLAFSGGGERKLKLLSRAPEMGEADVECEMSGYDGDSIEIGFNPGFITEALKVMNTENVIFELKAPNKPGLLKSGNDFVYVVMPVNLQ